MGPNKFVFINLSLANIFFSYQVAPSSTMFLQNYCWCIPLCTHTQTHNTHRLLHPHTPDIDFATSIFTPAYQINDEAYTSPIDIETNTPTHTHTHTDTHTHTGNHTHTPFHIPCPQTHTHHNTRRNMDSQPNFYIHPMPTPTDSHTQTHLTSILPTYT